MEKRNNGLSEDKIKGLIDCVDFIKNTIKQDENQILTNPKNIEDLEFKISFFKELLAAICNKLNENDIDLTNVMNNESKNKNQNNIDMLFQF